MRRVFKVGCVKLDADVCVSEGPVCPTRKRYPNKVTHNLIVYEKPATWMPLVREFLGPRLRPGALAQHERRRLKRMDIDDPDWLRLLASGLKVQLDSVEEEFASILESRTVLGYHGCRPQDLTTYLTGGIKALDSSDLMQLLSDAVGHLSDPGLGDGIFALGQRRLHDHTDSFVYFALDRRHLLRSAGHYLIYGSEWLCSVFAKDRALLRGFGFPTLLEVAFPLSSVSASDKRELVRHLLHEWTRLSIMNLQQSRVVDFSFAVRERIPAEMIVGHTHPSSINDPLEGGRQYVNDYVTCQRCVRRVARSAKANCAAGVSVSRGRSIRTWPLSSMFDH